MQNPPEGFALVADRLLQAAKLAKEIRHIMTDEGSFAACLDLFPDLNTVSQAGWKAVKEVTKARRMDDPFAFIEERELHTNTDSSDTESLGTVRFHSNPHGVDSTPTTPQPPAAYIDAAARDIPSVFADQTPSYHGKAEMVSSSLVAKLRTKFGHSLSAAQWATHESVLTGRLTVELVPFESPTIYKASGSSRNMFGIGSLGGAPRMEKVAGGYRGHIAIPKGKPTPFESFVVVATDRLWEWWRIIEAKESAATNVSRALSHVLTVQETDVDITGSPKGSGAFGRVYPGIQKTLKREVAIKIIEAKAGPDAIAHARGLAKVSHPNVVTVHDVGRVKHPTTGEIVDCVVMELIDGPSINTVWSTFDVNDAVSICKQIIDGLEAMHAVGVCHHDLHAGNVLVCKGTLKIIDIHYTETARLSQLQSQPKQHLLEEDCNAAARLCRNTLWQVNKVLLTPNIEDRLNTVSSLIELRGILADVEKRVAQRGVHQSLPNK